MTPASPVAAIKEKALRFIGYLLIIENCDRSNGSVCTLHSGLLRFRNVHTKRSHPIVVSYPLAVLLWSADLESGASTRTGAIDVRDMTKSFLAGGWVRRIAPADAAES